MRRTFLCGVDEYSGKDFEHRKEWVRSRIQELSRLFAMDVCGYTVMSNHLHVVVRNRPDLVCGWDDEEVARRWRTIFPLRRDPQTGAPEAPNELEIKALLGQDAKLDTYRERLHSVSWFMRCLNEWIARRGKYKDNICKRAMNRIWFGKGNWA